MKFVKKLQEQIFLDLPNGVGSRHFTVKNEEEDKAQKVKIGKNEIINSNSKW
jgi:parvulin-like peptidyl-prolyl isomerase